MENTNKKFVLDCIVSVLSVAVLVVLYFFWGCKIDLWVSILCAVLVVAGITCLTIQNKKLKEKNS